MRPDKVIFKWKDLSIYQQEDVFKIGTDAILLGAWIPTVIKSADRVLDVGTGTGILALMIHSAFPCAEINSIDHNENAVLLAGENFHVANAENRIKVKHESIFNFNSETKCFDLIVSNPPYYFEQIAAQKQMIRSAKHSGFSIEMWMNSFSHLLRGGGHVCIVLPYDTTTRWVKAANQSDLYVKDRLDIYSFKSDSDPARSLLHLQGELVKPSFNQLHIYEAENQYTDEYIALTGINPVRKKPR